MTNYATFTARIRKAKTIADCDKLDRSAQNLYEAGAFTVNEYGRIDGLIVDRRIALGQYA